VSGETLARSEASDATRGSAVKLAAELASRLIGLGTTLLLARWLGVADFGAFGRLSVLALLIAELGELGLQATASRALVAGTLSFRSLARARLVSSGLVGASAVASVGLQPVLAPLVLFFLLAGWGEFLGVALRCRGARTQEALLLLCLRAGSLVLAAIALTAGAGLTGLAWSQAVSPLPALFLGAALLRRRPAVEAPEVAVPAVLREAAPLAVNGGLQLLSPRVEFLVLSFLAGDRASGLFLAALRVLEFLAVVPSAIVAGAMPALTREALGGESREVRSRTALTVALLAAPAAVGVLLVAPGIVRLLFGDGYAGSVPPLRLLAIALVPLFMNALLSMALIAAGRAARLPRLTATRVVASFALALLLVPRFGVTGAALSLLLAESLLLLLAWGATVSSGFAVPIARPLVVALAATLPMASAVWGAGSGLLGAVAIGALTYLATLAALLVLRSRREAAAATRGAAGGGTPSAL
jgi:O-antigen/teichoic acid export membrane protein